MSKILKIKQELFDDELSTTDLIKTEERIEMKSHGQIAKRKKKNRRKTTPKRKKENNKRTKIRRNTAKFKRYVYALQNELDDQAASTSCREFRRESSAPPELSSSNSIQRNNQYGKKLDRQRSRTFSTVSENLKETIKTRPVLQMLIRKFDFDKAVKIIRLRKEFHEQERLRRLQKALLKNSEKNIQTPGRFTIKILNPVNV